MKYTLIKKHYKSTINYKNFKNGIELKWQSNNKKDCIRIMEDLSFVKHEIPEEVNEDYIIFTDFEYNIIKN